MERMTEAERCDLLERLRAADDNAMFLSEQLAQAKHRIRELEAEVTELLDRVISAQEQ
jgi:hypothetical protein